MTRNPRIPSTAHTTPLTSHLPQSVICLRITVIIIPILQWRHMGLRVQRLGRPRRDFGSWLHHMDRVQRHDPGFSALLPWTELQRANEASLPNPSFYRRRIWPLKVYIDWKRCATRKHIKPGARFQYSHTAEGNMVSIRALVVIWGMFKCLNCIKAVMAYSRTVLEPRLGNSVLVLLSCREAPNRLEAKVQLQTSAKDIKPLRRDGRVCRFVTSLLLLSLHCVEFKCLTLITNPKTFWELTG